MLLLLLLLRGVNCADAFVVDDAVEIKEYTPILETYFFFIKCKKSKLLVVISGFVLIGLLVLKYHKNYKLKEITLF